MSKTLAASVLALALGTLSMSAQAAETSGFYVGAGVGQSMVDESFIDDEDVGYQVFGGYQFNPYFGVEAAYTDFGKINFIGNIGRFEADTWSFVAVGTLPVTDRFAGYVKAGLQRWNAEISAPQFVSPTDPRRGTDPTYGLGLQFRFNDTVALRVEYSRFKVDDVDVDLAQVQVRFDF